MRIASLPPPWIAERSQILNETWSARLNSSRWLVDSRIINEPINKAYPQLRKADQQPYCETTTIDIWKDPSIKDVILVPAVA